MKNGHYILIIAPLEFPGKKYRERYCYEHTYVFWKNTGILPKKYELIHHKDENKHNNNFKNLELKSLSNHTREHTLPAPVQKIKCVNCKKSKEIAKCKYRYKIKKQKNIFCSRFCSGQYNSKKYWGVAKG